MLAEQKALTLFDAIESLGLIAAGKFESELTNEITLLAHSRFGVEKHWHKKIVRSGSNTLHPYTGDPLDRLIKKDDILFLDFGPVFDGFEADLGRTYVLGDDPLKLKLKNDVSMAWARGECLDNEPKPAHRSRLLSLRYSVGRNLWLGVWWRDSGSYCGSFPS